MTWTKINCEAREALVDLMGRSYGGFSDESGVVVGSGRTDTFGEFGDPIIVTEWVARDTEVPILKDVRHPGRDGEPDAAPCEHYGWSRNAATPVPVASSPVGGEQHG